MRTSAQYRKKLSQMKRNVYINGDKTGHDDPRLEPGIKVYSQTFDLVDDPEFKDLLTATSHITGKKINRFCHLYRSPEDLTKSHELTRKFQLRLGVCIQRCGGRDLLNACSSVSYDVDKEKGTEYYKRLMKFMKYFEEEDLTSPICITDAKGDRSLRPGQQWDPDQYVHIVEKKSDGIVVRGCKQHISLAAYADELVTLPTRAMRKEESDYAVGFVIPADWDGIKLVTTAHSSTRKHYPAPVSQYGGADSFVIFENTFIPWERVFICGESDVGFRIGVLGALYHRFNYSACKPALTEILIGATALAAEYNGIERAPHVTAKLADLIMVAELVYAAGTAASMLAEKRPSGTYIPNESLVHVARYLAGKNIYHEYQTLADIGGGLAGTLPYEGDFANPEIGGLLRKYIRRKQGVPEENIHMLWRYINDLVAGEGTGTHQVGGLHGGGSPVMEEIGLRYSYDVESKKNIVKRLAGIPEK
ncbi:MAG: 4-hydroxyphenylacetate 3-hydroxylase N-terminal domain-containing protein [Dehalococcoidales bacterium]|nr:4-hydroxyphenylacetate 3-hydroxylase N-terminal domain-containing protein [Dehalococcoidales bacterium]